MRDSTINGSYLRHPEKGLPSFPQSLFVRKKQYLVDPGFPVPLLGTEMSRNGTFSKSYASNFDRFGDKFDARSWESLEDTPT